MTTEDMDESRSPMKVVTVIENKEGETTEIVKEQSV